MGKRAFFGPGIYSANNPHAFRCYGQIELVLLVLKGNQSLSNGETTENIQNCDSVLGNRTYRNIRSLQENRSHYFDEIVVKSHEQVLPRFRYDRDLANNANLMWRVHQLLEKFIYERFPGQSNIPSQRVFPRARDCELEHKYARRFGTSLPSTSPHLSNAFAGCVEKGELETIIAFKSLSTIDHCEALGPTCAVLYNV